MYLNTSTGAVYLSIHFPLTREDEMLPPYAAMQINFQSTSLSRGKTGLSAEHGVILNLSIHFPLTRENYERA